MKNITLSSNGSRGHHRFQLYAEESTTDNTNSYMYFNFQLSPIQNGWDWSGWGSSINYSIMIGDNNFTGSIPNYDGRSTINLATRSNIKIPHNSDGTKTINVSFSVSDGTGQSYTCGNASDSGSLELSRLHKPPEISSVSFTEKNSQLLPQTANTIYNYLSNIEFKVNYTLFDGASISKIQLYDQFGEEYKGVISNNTITQDFSKHYLNTTIDKERFSIVCTDSLGASSTYNLSEINIVQYIRPLLVPTSSSVKRNGQLTGKVNLNVVGTFTNKTIHGVANAITLRFKYWKSTTQEPTTWFDIPASAITISGNDIRISKWNMAKNGVVISDVDSLSNYKFLIQAQDKFNKMSTIELQCSKGVWLMCRFKDRVDFNKITIQGKSVIPETIFNGSIVGGEGNTINGARRFLEVYAKIEFGEKNATLKYTIDTSLNSNECYGSALMTPFDEPNLNTIYISEAQYNKSTKILTHIRTGYFNTANGTYTSRNSNTSYAIYRVDTHD